MLAMLFDLNQGTVFVAMQMVVELQMSWLQAFVAVRRAVMLRLFVGLPVGGAAQIFLVLQRVGALLMIVALPTFWLQVPVALPLSVAQQVFVALQLFVALPMDVALRMSPLQMFVAVQMFVVLQDFVALPMVVTLPM